MAPYRLHPGIFAGAPALVFAPQYRPVWCPGAFAFCRVFPATHSAPVLALYTWLFVASGSPQTVPPVLANPFFGPLDADGDRPVYFPLCWVSSFVLGGPQLQRIVSVNQWLWKESHMPYREIAGWSAGTPALPLVHLRPPVWWPALLRSGLAWPPSLWASSAWLADLS